ncbi:unnamed protein product [Cuscuta epithymum]|uniref:Uncharacterized protein n=1 Tax=Cuscuta epithymum TaxID=186058 RepID=A0AAV0ER53_9ASTE|nr:unnamed protein product [Cuscuta epithymum]
MTPSSGGSLADAIPRVDLNKLTQSELLALSLCSCSAFDTRRTEDLVLPQVDRSLFNKSAGSKRQTYSRLGRHHHRTHRSAPASSPKPISSADPANRAVVHYLKCLLQNPNSSSPPPPPSSLPTQPCGQSIEQRTDLLAHAGNGKSKKGAKADVYVKKRSRAGGVEGDLELVNKNSVVVDFATLEDKGDVVFNEELRSRTVGLESEEEVLGFVRSLEGQWCSRRMKRKYVDASDFGDTLPVGWKLLIALRRRDGHVSLYCRRYVSPGGQQFLSCKEVAAFLRSHLMSMDANHLKDHIPSPIMRLTGSNSEKNVGSLHGHVSSNLDLVLHSNLSANELFLSGIDNLPDVQVKDLFECYNCNLTFQEKGPYFEHLLSFHQHTTKRIRVVPPVSEGVIIKEDGKYECQFCHKVFEERHRYNGHVGVHVRSNGKGFEGLYVQKSVDTLTLHNGFPSITPKIDALKEIAHNSMNSLPVIVNSNEAVAANTGKDIDPIMNPREVELIDVNNEKTLDCELNQNDKENQRAVKEIVKTCETQVTKVNLIEASKTYCEPPEVSNMQTCDPPENDARIGGNRQSEANNCNAVPETNEMTLEENVFQEGVTDSSMAISDTLNYFHTFTDKANKEQDEFCVLKIENEMSFEELTFDDIEPFKYDFSEDHNGCGMEAAFNTTSSLGFGSGEPTVLISRGNTNQLTTVCVWCRSEFSLEAFESESQSDSIGYMCPECKTKISGHLDNGLSLTSHDF